MTTDFTNDFAKLFAKKEELNLVLRLCIQEFRSVGTFIKHPLINMPYHESMNAYINALYQDKKEHLNQCEAANNWHAAVWLHERPWRIEAFNRYAPRMEREVAAEMLIDVWSDSEAPYQYRHLWRKLFRQYRDTDALLHSRAHLMRDGEDDEKLITLYRGMGRNESRKKNQTLWGNSWTIERSVAEWFGRRYRSFKGGYIAEATCKKRGIFCYLPERGEQEVVIDTIYLTDMKVSKVTS